MRRTAGFDDGIVGQTQAACLRPFLQGGFRIPRRLRGIEVRPPIALDKAPRRRNAAVEIERRNHGLADVRQDAGIFTDTGGALAARHDDEIAERNRPCHCRQCFAPNQRNLASGQSAFVVVGKSLPQKLCDDQIKYAVPEEFEPLVAPPRGGATLRRTRMGQRFDQQARLFETIFKRCLEALDAAGMLSGFMAERWQRGAARSMNRGKLAGRSEQCRASPNLPPMAYPLVEKNRNCRGRQGTQG